ncbi:NAD(P)-dependent oxidoreductase [Nocardia rhamnosiphila]
MSDSHTVALFGAGIMANAVAARLHAQGFELRRYNRTAAAIEGPAIVCTSPARAAEGAAVVWSFVHDDTASRAVWFGEEGALTEAGGAIVIESSTLSPEYADRWMKEASTIARPVLAPVTGSRPGAETGRLVAFSAGTRADLAAAEPWLRVIAHDVIQVGAKAAMAAAVKLLNNALASVVLTGLAETITAAATLGLDTEQLATVWSRHGWAAPAASAYGAAMVRGEHPLINCSLEVMAKDLRYMMAAANGTATPVIAAAAEHFQQALALGLGDQEMSAVINATRTNP